MSTAYTSPRAAAKFPPRSPNVAAGIRAALYDVSGSISTWALNDTITFPALPKGAIVTDVRLLASTALDTNGSPTLHVEVGYSGAATAFLAATAFGSSSTLQVAGTPLSTPMTADTPVIVTVSTAAATAAAGTLSLAIEYFVEPTAGSNP
jgi:hypothetical protein